MNIPSEFEIALLWLLNLRERGDGRDRVKGSAQKLVLLALRSFTNGERDIFPTISTLATRANLSDDTTRKALRALTDRGWVSVEDRYGEDGSQRSNLYRLHIHKAVADARGSGEIDADGLERMGRYLGGVSQTPPAPVTAPPPAPHTPTPPRVAHPHKRNEGRETGKHAGAVAVVEETDPRAAQLEALGVNGAAQILALETATPERVAWVIETAHTKQDPAAWAAAAIRGGYRPYPERKASTAASGASGAAEGKTYTPEQIEQARAVLERVADWDALAARWLQVWPGDAEAWIKDRAAVMAAVGPDAGFRITAAARWAQKWGMIQEGAAA